MATIDGVTADKVQEVIDDTITTGAVDGNGDLILTKHDLSTVNAGAVVGPTGPTGPAGAGSGPTGGATGQILAKASATDHDFIWQNYLRAIALTTQVTNYVLALSDAETMVMAYDTSPISVTIPTNGTVAFDVGTRIRVLQADTGETNIAAAGGVTLLYPPTLTPTLIGIGAVVEVVKLDTNTWVLNGMGNLATTELGWQEYTPYIGTTAAPWPDLGTGPVKKGYYLVNNMNQVFGGATVRWGTGSPTQGNGFLRFSLPETGINYDDSGYSPIGSASVGTSSTIHRAGLLHFNGSTPRLDEGLMAIDEGLFASHADPGNTENAHWFFSYELDPAA